jgi:hypothetical protein
MSEKLSEIFVFPLIFKMRLNTNNLKSIARLVTKFCVASSCLVYAIYQRDQKLVFIF